MIDRGGVDLCGRVAKGVEYLACELSSQHHLRALWEDEVIKEASGAGCKLESEFPQGGEANPSTGRRAWWLRPVGEANLDGFERRGSFEEGCQIPN